MRTRREVLRSQKALLELGRGLGEKHGLVGKDWGYDEMESGNRDKEKESKNGFRKRELRHLSSTSSYDFNTIYIYIYSFFLFCDLNI